MPKKILVIPDVQAKPDTPIEHLHWIGKYIVDKKPDIIVCLGDFADMPSLSSYDKGKKSYEGRRYKKDIEAARGAMSMLMTPMRLHNGRAKLFKKKLYDPDMHFIPGNHEDRITRAANEDPKLDGLISIDDLGYEYHGWKVHPYLSVVEIEGIAFSHYFTSGVMGRPITTANALLTKKHQSCIAGHQQGRQVAYGHKANGEPIIGMIVGSCYLHDEDYMGPQGNKHWRGVVMLHEVNNGSFDEMFVSLDYLRKKYN